MFFEFLLIWNIISFQYCTELNFIGLLGFTHLWEVVRCYLEGIRHLAELDCSVC